MRRGLALALLTLSTSAAAAPSFSALPTGNGFGFAVFDTEARQLTELLERPYRYVTAGEDLDRPGVYRRNLASAVGFGARVDGRGGWLSEQPLVEAGYVEQTGIVRAVSELGSVRLESYYFAPYGLEANALVLLVRATQRGASTARVELFARTLVDEAVLALPLSPSTTVTLGPGETTSFGLLLGFAPDQADLEARLRAFVAGRDPERLLADALAEWAVWRRPPPAGLSEDELRVYRQAEATLRMAQVREPYRERPRQKGQGMLLASLPPGIWHIGWVRDAAYAIVALAQSGHITEAEDGLRFFLAAEAGRYASYVRGPYRISVTRYFGDGEEESDWNLDGPNVELDGWGLFLWALRQTLAAAGDDHFLDEVLPTGERVLEVVRAGVAEPLLRNLEPDGLIAADTSIWEAHWARRKRYAYTSLAAARGLCDLAAVEADRGEEERAEAWRMPAEAIRAAVRARLVDARQVLAGSLEGLGRAHDGAVLEAFNWSLIGPADPAYRATMGALEARLRVASGGWKRNDDALTTYDENEWVLIDLRASQAYRRLGERARADELLAWVTAQARANHDLIPELFNVFPEAGPVGGFAGAAPMVGFGAGAYVLALRHRAGDPEPSDCGAPRPGRPHLGLPIAAGLFVLVVVVLLLRRRR